MLGGNDAFRCPVRTTASVQKCSSAEQFESLFLVCTVASPPPRADDCLWCKCLRSRNAFHVAILAAFPMPSTDDGVCSVMIARKQRLVMQMLFPGDK